MLTLLRFYQTRSVVISVFAIVILSILGILFKNEHHEFVGGEEDPENGGQVAGTIFIAVIIYAVRFPFRPSHGGLRARTEKVLTITN